MEIQVRFFAMLRQATGADMIRVQFDSPEISVRDAVQKLTRDYPKLKPYAAIVTAAVNGEYAGEETMLRHQDELALLPPISGGAN